ncbi:MAG: sensor histidine kinase [Bacteroidota bacterium]
MLQVHKDLESNSAQFSKQESLDSNNLFQLNLNSKLESATGVGTFQWNLSEDNFFCSDNFLKIIEIENLKNQFYSHHFFSLIKSEERNHTLEVMHQCITSNKEFDVTFSLKAGDGKMIRLHGFPEGDVTGKVLVGFIVDVSKEVNSDRFLLKGQDMERKRISMELHDSVGQKCVALKYMLALRKLKNDFSDFDSINTAIDEIINEIRAITHNLSSEIVSEIGLENAIAQLLNDSALALNAKHELDFLISDRYEYSIELKKMLYRIVQEALTNIIKHSEATSIRITVKDQNRQMVLKITDNGKGFDINQYAPGIGLQNIQKRVSYLNGHADIDSNVGLGTAINIKIPINHEEN